LPIDFFGAGAVHWFWFRIFRLCAWSDDIWLGAKVGGGFIPRPVGASLSPSPSREAPAFE